MVCMCWHVKKGLAVKRWLACKEIMHYRVGTLVLDVCLGKFCEDILSVVDTFLLLVVQEFFLCIQVVSVLVHYFFGGVSFITLLFVRVCKWF